MNHQIEKEITKELADKLMKIPGEARGICLKTDMEFVLREKGREGQKRVEEELEKLGYPIKYEEINGEGFYPIGQDILNMLIIWRLFGYDNEKMRQMGSEAPKVSIFTRMLARYFLSLKETLKQSQTVWGNHYTIGDVTVVAVDEEKRYAILRFENFDIHPILCLVLEGSLAKLCQMMIKGEKAICTETKCVFQGDDYHEFLLKW